MGSSVEAQPSYPSGPVTFVVPLPPGGTVDILSRAVAERLQNYTDQPFVVENVTGGATTIAAQRVARAPADGYTILIATSSTLSSNPHFYRQLGYKISDFEPITLLSENEFVVHIRKALPVSSVSLGGLPSLGGLRLQSRGSLTFPVSRRRRSKMRCDPFSASSKTAHSRRSSISQPQ